MARTILLASGETALVDDEDYERVSRYRWRLSPKRHHRYAQAHIRTEYHPDGRRKCVGESMHRLVMGCVPGDGQVVDHCNNDGLDNRKENLRLGGWNGNNRNRQPVQGRSSKYKGVTFFKRDRLWRASIKLDSPKRIQLGSFKDERDAALAYDFAARQHYGEFAVLNFPDITLSEPPKPYRRQTLTGHRWILPFDVRFLVRVSNNGKLVHGGIANTLDEALDKRSILLAKLGLPDLPRDL